MSHWHRREEALRRVGAGRARSRRNEVSASPRGRAVPAPAALAALLALLAGGLAVYFSFARPGGADRSASAPQEKRSVAPATELPEANLERPPQSQFESLLETAAASGQSDAANEPSETAADSIPVAGIPAALQWLANRDDQPAAGLRESLVRRWAEIDPAAAAEWINRFAPLSSYQQCVLQVATAWGGSDPAAAAQWAGSLPGDARSAALTSIAYEAARQDPVTALNVAAGLAPGAERDKLVAFATSQWAAADAKSAASWAAASQDESLRQRLVAAIAIGSAERDGGQAAALLAGNCPAGVEQNRAAVAILQRWTQQAPRDAASWLAAFPDTPARGQAAEVLVQLWAVQDPPAVAEWLHSLSEGSLRSAGLAALERGAPNRGAWSVEALKR